MALVPTRPGRLRIAAAGAALSVLAPAFALPQADPCKPAHYSLSGEVAQTPINPKRWHFDDNKFCPGGPGIPCALFIDPKPGIDFTDSTAISFEMYVVADCGTEMHLPLYDVESGCVKVRQDGGPAFLVNVRNSSGFDETGFEVCWSAQRCNGGFGNDPGGPGNEEVMDISFRGEPALCGVYVVTFTGWAGCIWELFANCDGTAAERFDIHDDLCDARDARNPLPELTLENLTVASAPACSVDWCVTAKNVGCTLVSGSVVRVATGSGSGSEDRPVPSLGSGESTVLCGNLAADGPGPETVTAVADPANALLECTESPNASSCQPATGGDQLSRVAQVLDVEPPSIACPAGETRVADAACCTDWAAAAGAVDDCDDAPAIVSDPPLPARFCGPGDHTVTYTATDASGNSASCTTRVVVVDATPPALDVTAETGCLWPPNHKLVDARLGSETSDNCAAPDDVTLAVSAVLSDEETADELGAGGPIHCPDAVVDGLDVLLRAERSGLSDGRVYTIHVTATDPAGNVSRGSVEVRVPHDQSPKTPGQVPGNDPDGPCPAEDSGLGVDATTCP